MKGIFNAVVTFFATIIGIVEFVFKALILLFNLLYQGLRILLSVIGFLPTPFIIGATGLIVVCILYKILGRENQS